MKAAPLYDDDYAGARWTYGLSYRPLSYANAPDGYILFSNREHPAYRFGTVDYPLPLDERRARQMDLELVSDPRDGAAGRGEGSMTTTTRKPRWTEAELERLGFVLVRGSDLADPPHGREDWWYVADYHHEDARGLGCRGHTTKRAAIAAFGSAFDALRSAMDAASFRCP